MSEKVYFVADRVMQKHECPWPTYHIETPKRLASILDQLEKTKLLDDENIEKLPSRLASDEEIRIVHTERYVDDVRNTETMTVEQQEEWATKYEDVYANKHTWRCAQMAAGSAIDLVQEVWRNKAQGMALVRPPGHHAMPDEGCGFCIFNNVAIAAKHAVKAGAQRVLIVDWDVHAGQGTQECIEDDDQIRLVSIHRYEQGTFWPNLEQAGVEHRFTNTLNVPLNGIGFGDGDYISIFNLVVLPMIDDWNPDLLIVSCGFDAALGDPEGYMKVTPAGYATMTRMLMNTGVPVAAILEGGYFLESIAADAEWVMRTFLGQVVPSIDLEPVHHSVAEVIKLLHLQHKDQYPTFRQLNEITKALSDEDKVANGCSMNSSFKGERTVCVPYQTRGIYEPFTEEKIEGFRKQLDAIVTEYASLKEYESIELKTLEQNETDEILKIDGHVVRCLKELERIVWLLIIVPLNPLSSFQSDGNEENVEGIDTKKMIALAYEIAKLRGTEKFDKLPIFRL